MDQSNEHEGFELAGVEQTRSIGEIVDQLGFVETSEMQDLQAKIIEAKLRNQLEEVVELAVQYRVQAMPIREETPLDRRAYLDVALELSMAQIWKDIDRERYVEAMNDAYDLAEGLYLYGVMEDMAAMAQPDQPEEDFPDNDNPS